VNLAVGKCVSEMFTGRRNLSVRTKFQQGTCVTVGLPWTAFCTITIKVRMFYSLGIFSFYY